MSEPPKSSNTWLIVGVIVGVFVLLCGGGAAGLMFWVKSSVGDFKAVGEEVRREALDFAAHGDDRACLEEGFSRSVPCKDLDIECNVRATVFTSFCLDAATPTDGFCEGVPLRSEFLAFTKYSTQVCADRGLMGHQGCSQVLQRVAEHCEGRAPAVPSP